MNSAYILPRLALAAAWIVAAGAGCGQQGATAPEVAIATAGGAVVIDGAPGDVYLLIWQPDGTITTQHLSGPHPPVVPPKPQPDPPPAPDPPDPIEPSGERWVILLADDPSSHQALTAAIQTQHPKVRVSIKTPNQLPTYAKLIPSNSSLPYVFLIEERDGPALLVERDEYVGAEQVLGWLSGIPPPSDVERVAYVYEQRDAPVPLGIMAAIRDINAAGEIEAVTIEDDEPDLGEWQDARGAAVEAGLPALVLIGGDVVRVVKVESYEDVMEATR